MAKLTKADRKVLKDIAAATAAGNSFMTEAKVADKLLKAGFVKTNPQMTNQNGEIAAMTTDAGNVEAATEAAPRKAPERIEAPIPDGGFELENNVPVAEGGRRGRPVESPYPFAKMEMGQSFFVPASETLPEPAKKLASVVSAANKRHFNDEPRRFFVIRADTKNGQVGARIHRTAPPAPRQTATSATA